MGIILVILYLVFVCLIGGWGGMLIHKKAPRRAERLGEGENCISRGFRSFLQGCVIQPLQNDVEQTYDVYCSGGEVGYHDGI